MLAGFYILGGGCFAPSGRMLPRGKSLAASHTTNPEARDFYVRLENKTCVPIPHSIPERNNFRHWDLSPLLAVQSTLLITKHLLFRVPAACGQSHALPICSR